MLMILEIIIKIDARFLLIIVLFLIQILSFLVNECQRCCVMESCDFYERLFSVGKLK